MEEAIRKVLDKWVIGTPTDTLIRMAFEEGVKYGKEEKEVRKEV